MDVNEIHIQDGVQMGTNENTQKGAAPFEDFLEEKVENITVKGTECFERTFCNTKFQRDTLNDVVNQTFDNKSIRKAVRILEN